MSVFVTKNTTLMRISSKHMVDMRLAIDQINKVIQEAEEFPIKFPSTLLGTIHVLRHELIRKLKDEAGWTIYFENKGAYQGVLDDQVDTVVLNIGGK